MGKSGNGGLSLRRTGSIISNLHRFKHAARGWNAYEDSFYSHYVKTFNPFFRIPDVKTALMFSFDSNPQEAYELNRRQLPFGCHAWFREEAPHYINNLPFWKPIIESSLG